MNEEYDYFEISPFTEDLLNVFINHGYGNLKMYETTCFNTHLCDETACMTIADFYEKAHGIEQ